MTNNALSRSLSTLPMWLVQGAIAVLLSGGITWCTWASVSNWKHEVRLGIVETKVDNVHQDIQDIKDSQLEMNRKLDRLIERTQPQPRIYGR
jgi:hypothetical protein